MNKNSDQLLFLHSLFNGCYRILSNQTAFEMSFPDTLCNFFAMCEFMGRIFWSRFGDLLLYHSTELQK